MVSIRIQRPSTRIWLTALEGTATPDTCITASSSLFWLGAPAPTDSGTQSILRLHEAGHVAVASGELHTMPSAHCTSSSCSSFTLVIGWRIVHQRQAGRIEQSVSPPSARWMRAASSAARRLNERSRSEP